MSRKIFLTALLLISAPAFAEQPKMPVEIVATADDQVGKRLIYFVKEGIQSSSMLSLSINPDFGLKVMAITLDQSQISPGNSTVYSFVITMTVRDQPVPYYLNQYVGYCGTAKVQECAQGLVANIAEDSDQVLRLLKAAFEQAGE